MQVFYNISDVPRCHVWLMLFVFWQELAWHLHFVNNSNTENYNSTHKLFLSEIIKIIF